MKFKAKLRKIGNSVGVLLPREVITGTKLGEDIELEVITNQANLPLEGNNVITAVVKPRFNLNWCSKHNAYKGTCGCK